MKHDIVDAIVQKAALNLGQQLPKGSPFVVIVLHHESDLITIQTNIETQESLNRFLEVAKDNAGELRRTIPISAKES